MSCLAWCGPGDLAGPIQVRTGEHRKSSFLFLRYLPAPEGVRYGPGRNNNQDRILGAQLLANLDGLGFALGQGSVPALAPVLDDHMGSTAGFPTSPFLPPPTAPAPRRWSAINLPPSQPGVHPGSLNRQGQDTIPRLVGQQPPCPSSRALAKKSTWFSGTISP